MDCQHCNKPNPEGYFNCRSCGERASKSKWTQQFVVRENSPWATAIRKDQIDFNEVTQEEAVKKLADGAKNIKRTGTAKRIM